MFMLTDREGIAMAPLTNGKGFVGLNKVTFCAVFLNILLYRVMLLMILIIKRKRSILNLLFI